MSSLLLVTLSHVPLGHLTLSLSLYGLSHASNDSSWLDDDGMGDLIG